MDLLVDQLLERGLITDTEVWLEMIRSRNKTAHTYNGNVAEEIVGKIHGSYFQEFNRLEKLLIDLSTK
jgi:nucleotidyltransferase substrate binding protein (TIGR01987 family)